MNCRKAIKQLPAYLDHELSQEELRGLEDHLEVCVFCSTELSALRATSKMLDAWEGTSPRRYYVESVINRIRAEQRGAGETSGIGWRPLERRWATDVLRAAAGILFLIGISVFSGHVPIERAMDEIALGKSAYLHTSESAVPLAEELIHSDIRPSEYGLVWSGMNSPSPFVKASASDLRVRRVNENDFFPGGGRFPQVNHIYFPGEGMPVESVIPLELP